MFDTKQFRFALESGSKKHLCPACDKRRFVRYIDTATGEYVAERIGRCDREQSCGYHVRPDDVADLNTSARSQFTLRRRVPQRHGRIPFQHVRARLGRYESNQLICWLATLPGWTKQIAEATARLYLIGTGGNGSNVDGWPIFWQVDNAMQVRSGKLIRYDQQHGKRIKGDGFNYTWIHSQMIKAGLLPDDKSKWTLEQCLFGLHLVTPDETRPIAIVEGEKTALIASQYYPKFVWLSCGQLNGLSTDKFKPLTGRKIVLFPDKGGAFEIWQKRAGELSTIHKIVISDLLEKYASTEHDGYDIADFLIQYDLRTFLDSTQSTPPPAPYGSNPYTGEVFDQRCYPADWDSVPLPGEGEPERTDIERTYLTESDQPEILQVLADVLGAEIVPDADPDEIDSFWAEHDRRANVTNWRTRTNIPQSRAG
jgi:hypothetical protein